VLESIAQHLDDLSGPISQFGPITVLLLLMLPLGEELILIPAGMLVGHGSLPMFWTWMCAFIGVVFSDGVWFFISRHYGAPLLHKRWFKRIAHPRRLLQAKHQIEKRGAWVVVTARFVPGSRTTALVMAGLLHMPVWKYLLVNMSAAPISVTLQLGLGYLIAQGVGTKDKANMLLWVVAVGVLIVVGGAAYRWISSHLRRGGDPPRARAVWLRRLKSPRVRKPASAQAATAKGSTSEPHQPPGS